MKLEITKTPMPTREELFEVLKAEFSEKYKVKLIGIGPGKGILLRKSGLAAVGIYIRGNGKMNIFGRFGYLWIQALLGGLILMLIAYPKWKKMEKEAYAFLKSKYA